MNGIAADITEHAPPSTPAQDVIIAAFSQRFIAFYVDLCVLSVYLRASDFVLPYLTRPHSEFDYFPAVTWAVLVNLGVLWLYCALLESSRWRATLGKMLVHIQVTDALGNRISFLHASSRFLAKYLYFLIFYPVATVFLMSIHTRTDAQFAPYVTIGLAAFILPLLDALFIALTRKKQSLHDLIAGTVVVERSVM